MMEINRVQDKLKVLSILRLSVVIPIITFSLFKYLLKPEITTGVQQLISEKALVSIYRYKFERVHQLIDYMSTTSTVDTIIVRIPTQPYALNKCGLAYTLEQYSTINWRKTCRGFYYQDGTARMNDRMIHTRQLMEYGS